MPDLLVTDPPYGIGADKKMKKQSGTQYGRSLAVKRDYGDTDWDSSVVELGVILGYIDMAKYAVVFGGNYYHLPPSACWLVWDKVNGENNFADCELAWTNYPGAVRIYRHMWNGMLRKDGEDRQHPTQKPLHLMRWAIGKSPKSELVIDPFMGSGTTLRAAKDLGRKAIGIELNERYCEIAARRMCQEVLAL